MIFLPDNVLEDAREFVICSASAQKRYVLLCSILLILFKILLIAGAACVQANIDKIRKFVFFKASRGRIYEDMLLKKYIFPPSRVVKADAVAEFTLVSKICGLLCPPPFIFCPFLRPS